MPNKDALLSDGALAVAHCVPLLLGRIRRVLSREGPHVLRAVDSPHPRNTGVPNRPQGGTHRANRRAGRRRRGIRPGQGVAVLLLLLLLLLLLVLW